MGTPEPTASSRTDPDSHTEAMRKLLYPRSIAILGASDNPKKLSGRPIDYLKRFEFSGRIIPINTSREQVQDLPAYASLDDVDGEIDLAMIMLSADRAAGAVRACGARGIPAAIIGASGFAEAGERGVRLQHELEAAIAETGTLVLGPNCLGMVSVADHAVPTFTSALDETIDLHEGPVALVSQSGAFGFFMFGEAQRASIGISHCLSTGNEAGLSVPEILHGLVHTDNARVLLAYLEGVSDGKRLMEAARDAHELDKPIIAVKVGRSVEGARAARSHTASLAGEDAVFDGMARQHGIIRVDGMDALLDAAQLFATGRRAKGRALTALTVSGGAGVLMTDAASVAGIDVRPWDEVWQQKMATVIPEYGSPVNPVDLTGSLISQPEMLHRALDIAVEHPNTDMIAVLVGNADNCADEYIEAIEHAHRSTDRPIAVVWTGGSGRPQHRLRELGIPCYSDPGRAASALGMLAGFSLRPDLPRPSRPIDVDLSVADGVIATARASGRTQLDEYESSRIVASYGVPCAPASPADSPAAAASAAERIGGPVALKLLSERIGHKSDIGGVRLGVSGRDAVLRAGDELLRTARDAGVYGARLLVQRMTEGDVELIIGLKHDPTFGPVVVVGLGGILVDVLDDSQVAVAPVDEDTARGMLLGLRGSKLFAAVRGRPACDLDAAASAIARLSWLAADLAGEYGDIAEFDVNPLLLDRDGQATVAVDCLAVLTDHKGQG